MLGEGRAGMVRMGLGLGLTALLCGCEGTMASTAQQSTPDTGTFLAFANAFDDFHSWESTPGVSSLDIDSGIHSQGPLVAYINHRPPSGSTSFPIGTVIVKEVAVGDLTTRSIFAMAKRGGDFDPGGAVNWEWFELQNVDATHATIIWRGNGPPGAETYGGDPQVCNSCHEGAQSNDYVWTTGFQLSSF